jgi:2-dehydropantoate 2-reductase
MIRNVSLVGIGAVGSIYAWRLSNFLGRDHVQVMVDPQRKSRYAQDGIFLNNQRIDFNYCTVDEVSGPVDLIIVATKNHHLKNAAELISNQVGPETAILSLLNGLDSEEYLASLFGKEHVLYGFTTAMDSTRIQNQISFTKEGIIHFGESDNSLTPRVDSICSLFKQAQVAYKVTEDIHREMWAKFMVNVSINTISAIAGANYGACATIPALRQLIIDTQREVVALAQAKGIVGLDDTYIDRYQKIFASLEPSGKTSMLQDIEAGRPTENEWFCKTASRFGRETGIPTPLCDILGRLMEGMETIRS